MTGKLLILEKHGVGVSSVPRLCARPSVGVGFPGVGNIPIVKVGKLRHRGADFLVLQHTVEW